MSDQAKRQCSACAEEILVAAKKCKHCGEWLHTPGSSASDGVEKAKSDVPPTAEALFKAAYDAHHKALDLELATDLYTRVLADYPEARQARYAQTQLDNLQRDQEKLQARLRRRREIESADEEAAEVRAAQQKRKERYQEALDLHYRQKSPEKAARLYQGLIDEAPSSPEAQYSRTQLRNIAKKPVASIGAPESGLPAEALEPDSPLTPTHAPTTGGQQDSYRSPFRLVAASALFGLLVLGIWVARDRDADSARRAEAKNEAEADRWHREEAVRHLARKEWDEAVSKLELLGDRSRQDADVQRALDEARLRKYQRAVLEASKQLCATSNAEPRKQSAYMSALLDVINDAPDFKVAREPADAFRKLVAPTSKALEDLVAFDKRLGAAPVLPDKPRYRKPDRRGLLRVWKLSGIYRGAFDGGGIVLSKGSAYYVVRDAERPNVERVSGYVQTVDYVELDFDGGRLATVVQLSDRLAYEESKRAYAEEVRAAKAEHRTATTAFRHAQRTLGQRLAAYERQLGERPAFVQAEQQATKALCEELKRATHPATQPLGLGGPARSE